MSSYPHFFSWSLRPFIQKHFLGSLMLHIQNPTILNRPNRSFRIIASNLFPECQDYGTTKRGGKNPNKIITGHSIKRIVIPFKNPQVKVGYFQLWYIQLLLYFELYTLAYSRLMILPWEGNNGLLNILVVIP